VYRSLELPRMAQALSEIHACVGRAAVAVYGNVDQELFVTSQIEMAFVKVSPLCEELQRMRARLLICLKRKPRVQFFGERPRGYLGSVASPHLRGSVSRIFRLEPLFGVCECYVEQTSRSAHGCL
jgi:hypothetical protein